MEAGDIVTVEENIKLVVSVFTFRVIITIRCDTRVCNAINSIDENKLLQKKKMFCPLHGTYVLFNSIQNKTSGAFSVEYVK